MPRRKEGQDALYDEGTLKRMMFWREIEPSLSERGSALGVRQCKLLGGFEHRFDRHVVSRFGAFRKLKRDLGRQRASGDENVRGLAIEASPDRIGHSRPDRLSDQVVTKGQAIPVVDEEIRLEKLCDRVNELANRQ